MTNLRQKLRHNVVENIGLANIELVFEVLSATTDAELPAQHSKADRQAELPMTELKLLLTKAIVSPISKICLYMEHVFANGYYVNDTYEPFPQKLSKLALLSTTDMPIILNYMGMLYFKGMDDIFWELLADNIGSNEKDILLLHLLRGVDRPAAWILAYLYTYAKYNLCLDAKSIACVENWAPVYNEATSWEDFAQCSAEKIAYECRRLPSSGYFYIWNKTDNLSQDIGLVAFNIKIENIKQIVRINIQPGERAVPCKFNSIGELLAAGNKSGLHLQDLGLLQICGNELFCWIEGKRYALVVHNNRTSAKKSFELDQLIYSQLIKLPKWNNCEIVSRQSHIIEVEEYLADGMPRQCRSYYTIYEALPYALPLDFPALTFVPPRLSIMACMLLWFIFEIEGIFEIKHLESICVYSKLHKQATCRLSPDLKHAIQQPQVPQELRDYFNTIELPACYQFRLSLVRTLLM
jgi:hypothetical protein